MTTQRNPAAPARISTGAVTVAAPSVSSGPSGTLASSRAAQGPQAVLRMGMAALALFAASTVQAGPAHQHGVAQLMVAVEGSSVAIEFESPMENLVGFEHAPRTQKQREAIETLKHTFSTPDKLFVPTAAAGCSAGPAELALPDYRHGDGHADLHASISFRCKSPAALQGLTVHLFERFSRLERVKTQLVVPGRQSAVDLTRRRTQLAW